MRGASVRLRWCLLFVLIRQGLRGVSGPQRLTRALVIETGNPIMTFEQRSSFLMGVFGAGFIRKSRCRNDGREVPIFFLYRRSELFFDVALDLCCVGLWVGFIR